MSATDIRLAMQANGYAPVACTGKRPTVPGWQHKTDASPAEMALWAGANTGCSRQYTPTIDIDITDPEAADARRGGGPGTVRRSRHDPGALRALCPSARCHSAPRRRSRKCRPASRRPTAARTRSRFSATGSSSSASAPTPTPASRTLGTADAARHAARGAGRGQRGGHADLSRSRLRAAGGGVQLQARLHQRSRRRGRRRPGGRRRSSSLDALRRRRRQQRPRHAAARHRVTAAQWGQFRRNCAHCPRRHPEGRQPATVEPRSGTGTTSS